MIDDFRGPYRWLSNFHMVDVEFEGITYPSTEHAFQAAKTTDEAERWRIAALPTCRDAKREGYKVTLRKGWDDMRVDVMRRIVREKFSDKHPELRVMLLETGNERLIEGNTWGDKFWGVCDGVGENWLGKILMEVREELRQDLRDFIKEE